MTQFESNSAHSKPNSDDLHDPKEIEREIEHTRDAISDDIRALGAKVTPSALKAEAKEALVELKDAAVGKVASATNNALRSARATAYNVGDKLAIAGYAARRAGDNSLQFARSHALLLSLLGLGGGLLIATIARRRAAMNRRLPAVALSHVRRVGSLAGDRARRDLRRIARSGAMAFATQQVRSLLVRDHPAALGATLLTLAVGALVRSRR